MLIEDVKGVPPEEPVVLVGDTPLIALHTGDEWQMIRV